MFALLLVLACATDPVDGDVLPAPGDPLGAPVEVAGREVLTTEGAVVVDGTVRVTTPGRPDRVAVSPDGRLIAYVDNRSGLASVWVVGVDEGEPTQLTNVGLTAGAGRPDGWVPPPSGPIAFDGDELVWTSPEGTHRVRIP